MKKSGKYRKVNKNWKIDVRSKNFVQVFSSNSPFVYNSIIITVETSLLTLRPRGKSLIRNPKSYTPKPEIPFKKEKFRTLNVEVINPSMIRYR